METGIMIIRLRIFFLIYAIFCTASSSFAFEKADLVKLMSSNQCSNCDLTMADLSGKDLKGANLMGADLFGADLSYADLSGANLTSSILIGANLKRTNLENANVDKADLREIDLTKSKIKNVNLENVLFCRTKTPWVEGGIDRDCNRGFFDRLFSGKYEAKTIEGGFYIGELGGKTRNGIGVFTVPGQYRYLGEWEYGKKHGRGSLNFDNGDYFSGEFKDGEKWTGNGKITRSNGDAYEGDIKDGTWNGKGTYTWADGGKHVGQWKDGKRHGEGIGTFSSGHRYVGKWINGEPQGQFQLTYPDGLKYEGAITDGYPDGQGTMNYSNGHKYEGSWRKGEKYGKGTYTWPEGHKYEGEWKGVRNGYGKFTASSGYKYEGQWKDDKQHGRGKATYYDGRVEDGAWKAGEYIGEWTPEREAEFKASTTYPFTISVTPSNARVRIMNINPKYQDGMELQDGEYDVLVDAPGYQNWRRKINHSGKATDLEITLLEAQRSYEWRKGDKPESPKSQIIIAIDPGHGGKDKGNKGINGTLEKDVTLAIAHKLKSVINNSPGYQAVLTRKSDRHIDPRKRVEIAREHRSDLFLSLHTDDFDHPKCEGVSVYALSLDGASAEAANWLANKENEPDLIGGISLADKDDLIASVLLDLSQTATIQDSLELGSHVLKHLAKIGKLDKGAVQQTAFEELKAPDMPSIYINISCITNAKEERRLSSSDQQQEIANAIFLGIRDHILGGALTYAVMTVNGSERRVEMDVWVQNMSRLIAHAVGDLRARTSLLKLVYDEAMQVNLEPELLLAVIEASSNFDQFAISSAGARGLMQIMPFWLNEISLPNDNLFDMETNLRMGCKILRYYLDEEDGSLGLALERYNGSHGFTEKVGTALRRYSDPNEKE